MFSPTWIAERLQAEGVLSATQVGAAVKYMRANDERIEEALIQTRALDELALLRFISDKTHTKYLSTMKLAALVVPDEALGLFTERTAENLRAFPLQYDRRKRHATIITPDAGNPDQVKQISVALGLTVKAYLVRPAAIDAAIRKWYRGEIQAFAAIAPETFTQLGSRMDLLGDSDLMHEDGSPASGAPTRGSQAASADGSPPAEIQSAPAGSHEPFTQAGTSPEPAPAQPALPSPDQAAARAASLLPGVPTDGAPVVAESAATGGERRIAELAEMLNVLVALNENARDEFQGHSASVARLSRQLVEKMGMGQAAAVHAGMAANLHDLGKPVAYHLTAINLSQYATHRTAAQKLYLTPLRLLESIDLPAPATRAVAAMYERFDGKGFPSGVTGKDIPVGARILALCDAHSELTLNPRNPYRRVLSQEEALKVLSEFRGTLFDPDLVDLLIQIAAGEHLKRQLSEHRPVVLLVEPAPEEATIMELRLVAQGFDVKVARNADQAIEFAESDTLNFVLSEVELQPIDGFELLTRLRGAEATADVPFIFVARASDTAAIDRAFSLGAQDYVVKPTSGDVLAAKLRRVAAPKSLRQGPKGISGSLAELALPDLAQILGQGRKTGKLHLRVGSEEGEVHFDTGQIVHAQFRKQEGVDAFYELLCVAEGSFSLDPTFQPSSQTISMSVEGLILEGLRRLDEQSR